MFNATRIGLPMRWRFGGAPGGGEPRRPYIPRTWSTRRTYAGTGTALRNTKLKCLQQTRSVNELSTA